LASVALAKDAATADKNQDRRKDNVFLIFED